MHKRITSFGYIWLNSQGQQIAVQVGHEWNGEVLSIKDRRILRRIKK